MPTYTLSKEAIEDLQNIWDFISADSEDAADRVLNELFEVFQQLAEMPGMGHTRHDLTRRDVRFWPLRSYLIVYRDRPLPLQIVAELHGAQDVPSIIGE